MVAKMAMMELSEINSHFVIIVTYLDISEIFAYRGHDSCWNRMQFNTDFAIWKFRQQCREQQIRDHLDSCCDLR